MEFGQVFIQKTKIAFFYILFSLKSNQNKPILSSFFDKNVKEYQNHQNHDQIQEASNFTTESIAGMYLVNYRCKLDSLKIFLMKICHLKIEIETRVGNQK